MRLPRHLLSASITVAGGLIAPVACAQLTGVLHGPPPLPANLPAMVPQVAVSGHVDTPRIDDLLRGVRAMSRPQQIQALLRDPSQRVALDPSGNPVLRGEFLATGLTDAEAATLQGLGFQVERAPGDQDDLGLHLAIVRDMRRRSEADALLALERGAPGASFTYQHLYLPAGAIGAADDSIAPATAEPRANPAPIEVGLIDGGIATDAPALAHTRITRFGCARPDASPHGTAVASLLADGVGDRLYAANLWCADAVGGATSSLIRALAWMDREHVPVINISLVGPDNPLLARAVQAMLARGHVLVAAVGNDGPAAPPLYPAAYPGVIGVSAVDRHDRLLPESGAGPQVAFCALGVVGEGDDAMRGTSFAAPIVARRAAQLLAAPQTGAAARVEAALARQAQDLGAPGRDPRYGFGLLAPEG